MSKYYVEKLEIVKFSEFLESLIDKNSIEFKRFNRLYDILGNVEISTEYLKAYISSFNYASKRSDIRYKEDTLLGTYLISKSFPMFSSQALLELLKVYLKDIFEEYKPMEYFKNVYSDSYKDETFKQLLEYIEKIGKISDELFKEEAVKVDDELPAYSKKFKTYLKDIIINDHISFESIKKFIPQSELISIDEEHLENISKKALFGYSTYPLSYMMTKSMIIWGDLSDYEAATYDYCGHKIEATFTIQDFIKSVAANEKKLLEKK